MVGRNPDKALSVGGTGTSPSWEELIEKAAADAGVKVKSSAGVSGGSDHASFVQKRIPAVHLFTGFHADYHRQTDHPEKIAYKRMSKIGQFALRLLVSLADLPERPKFTGDTRRLLGITGGDISDEDAENFGLDDGQGGILVETVSGDSAAEVAGVEQGDIILSLGGKRIPRDRGMDILRRAIRRAQANQEIEMIVLRGGEEKTLKIVWEE